MCRAMTTLARAFSELRAGNTVHLDTVEDPERAGAKCLDRMLFLFGVGIDLLDSGFAEQSLSADGSFTSHEAVKQLSALRVVCCVSYLYACPWLMHAA